MQLATPSEALPAWADLQARLPDSSRHGRALCRSRVEEFMAKFNEESRAFKLDLVLFQGGAGRWGWGA